MANDDPIPGVKHGTRQGYKAGCHCLACRRWNADEQKAYRARAAAKEASEQAGVFVRPGAGKFEVRVLKVIAELGATGEQAEMVHDLMVFNAQLLDSIPESGRWHLAQGAQKTLLELFKQLKELAPAKRGVDPATDLGGFVDGLTKAGARKP